MTWAISSSSYSAGSISSSSGSLGIPSPGNESCISTLGNLTRIGSSAAGDEGENLACEAKESKVRVVSRPPLRQQQQADRTTLALRSVRAEHRPNTKATTLLGAARNRLLLMPACSRRRKDVGDQPASFDNAFFTSLRTIKNTHSSPVEVVVLLLVNVVDDVVVFELVLLCMLVVVGVLVLVLVRVVVTVTVVLVKVCVVVEAMILWQTSLW